MSLSRLKIFVVRPALAGHLIRGTGVYANNLYKNLKKRHDCDVELAEIPDNQESYDIVHFPYFDPFFLTLKSDKWHKTVITVHDLIPLKYPEYFPKGLKGKVKWWFQKNKLKKAIAIITDSFSSKRDIVKYTGVRPERIHVAYLGVDDEFKKVKPVDDIKKVAKIYKLPEKFILNVGDVNFNKNIPGLIEAFAAFHEVNRDVYLVLVGKGFIEPTEQLSAIENLILRYGLNHRVIRTGNLPTEDLAAFYNLAAVYIQPSLAEGFGLTVLEAFAGRCPVISSHESSLGEICGNAAYKIDPKDTAGMTKALEKLISDGKLRTDLIEKGSRQVKKFSWEKCAADTVRIYRKILE